MLSKLFIPRILKNTGYIAIVNTYSYILILVAIVSLLAIGIIEIILETRAIKNVPLSCEEYLKSLEFTPTEISATYSYLYQKSLYILKWYPGASIQTILVFSLALTVFA